MGLKIVAEADHHTNYYGKFRMLVVHSDLWKGDHVVLVKGTVINTEKVPCRIQSHCLPGISLNSSDCDCKSQLDFSMKYIKEKEIGILIYLNQEGRGHGLPIKIKALNNKNKGMDTFSAVSNLGLHDDIRTYDVASEILNHLKPKSIELLTNNPEKITSMMNNGIKVASTESVPSVATERNRFHLEAKAKRGHKITLIEEK